jgi:two-component system OmpR family response regulator
MMDAVRVLIVEDELRMASLIRRGLVGEGIAADTVASGEEALWRAQAHDYDAIVLDVMLPGLNGFETCRRLRTDGVWVPVLMLTARDAVSDRVAGLDSGADDYLAKPFAMAELRARVRALRRRMVDDRAPRIIVGDLELDPATLGVRRGERQIRLTVREFALLELLASHPGQIFSQDRLIDALWDADFAAESNVVEVYVRSLRRKIDDGRRDGIIETVRGSGYRLRAASET